MANVFFENKWQKLTAIVGVTIIALVLILTIFINAYWSPILAGKVKEVVLKSSDSLYNINFSSAELQVLRGSIVINNITFEPDTAVYNRKKKVHLAPNNLIKLFIKKLTLSHIHPFTLYFKHKLDIGEMILNNPELSMSYQLNHTKDTVVKDNRTPWQKISKSLRSIHVGKISLGDVKFRYEDYSGNKLAISEIKELYLNATDLLIDSATQTDKSRLAYCKDILIKLNNYTGKTASGLYTYKVNSLSLSTQKSQLDINGLTLKPVKPAVFFEKSHSDRYTLSLDSLRVNHFDFLIYHKYRTLSASSLILSHGAIQIFSNPKPSTDKSDRVKTFPNVGLFKINSDIKLDTILLNRFKITYSEFNVKSKQTGSIDFNNTSGRILNITTEKTVLLKNPICNIDLTTYFMNQGKLDVSFDFNLVDKENSFSYKGSLGQMDLQAINAATMPLSMVKITSGTVKQLNFDIHANNKIATGKVKILYNNLKVTLLKPDTLDNLKHRTIASLFANIFILKHDNPDVPGGIPRSFLVTNLRKPEIPFFKFTWQTLLNGLKPAVGFDLKTQKATKALASKQIINKQNRKIKKQLRIQRRSERRKKRAEKKLLQQNAA